MTSLQDLAREAAGRVLSDLTDRQGIGDAITLCDEEIQNEIRDTVTSLILPSLEAAVGERDKILAVQKIMIDKRVEGAVAACVDDIIAEQAESITDLRGQLEQARKVIPLADKLCSEVERADVEGELSPYVKGETYFQLRQLLTTTRQAEKEQG